MSDHTHDESIARQSTMRQVNGSRGTLQSQMGTDYQGSQTEAHFRSEMTKLHTRLAPIHAQQLHEQEVLRNRSLAEAVAIENEQGRS